MSKLFRRLSLSEESLVSAGMDFCSDVKFFDINKDYLQFLFGESESSDSVDSLKQTLSLNSKHLKSISRYSKSSVYGVPYTYGKSKTKSKRCKFFSW